MVIIGCSTCNAQSEIDRVFRVINEYRHRVSSSGNNRFGRSRESESERGEWRAYNCQMNTWCLASCKFSCMYVV